MDEFTRKHLDQWLYAEIVNEDRREMVRAAMVREFDADPEFWSRTGWTRLYDAVAGSRIGEL